MTPQTRRQKRALLLASAPAADTAGETDQTTATNPAEEQSSPPSQQQEAKPDISSQQQTQTSRRRRRHKKKDEADDDDEAPEKEGEEEEEQLPDQEGKDEKMVTEEGDDDNGNDGGNDDRLASVEPEATTLAGKAEVNEDGEGDQDKIADDADKMEKDDDDGGGSRHESGSEDLRAGVEPGATPAGRAKENEEVESDHNKITNDADRIEEDDDDDEKVNSEREEDEEDEDADPEPSSQNDDDVDDDAAAHRTPPPPPPPLPTKPQPMVDVAVHRMRHLHYHPKPIVCMAKLVVPNKRKDKKKANSSRPAISQLAVSRENGTVEVLDVLSKLYTITSMNHPVAPLTSLVWTTVVGGDGNDDHSHLPILVGASRSDLYIVDFYQNRLLPCPSDGGAIFCLCRIGRDTVAAGCQDGSIRIYRVVEEGQRKGRRLEQIAKVSSAGAAVLSLSCRDTIDQVIFAGVADGTIRRYEKQQDKGEELSWKPSSLRMTVECLGRSTPTRVWALKAAKDGTLVSGDSLGHVQFWDGNTGVLIRSFDQNDNKADVLDLDMTANECKVFASGVNSRVVCIERTDTNSQEWILTHAQRPHTHDVKAVRILQGYGNRPGGEEIVCTGGLDTKLCTYSALEFARRRPSVIYPWPSLKSPVAAAKQSRLLTMLREDRVDVYEFAPRPEDVVKIIAPVKVHEDETLIGTVQVKGSANLAFCAISDSGRYLALSDSFALLLFELKLTSTKKGTNALVPSKIPVKLPGKSSISSLHFLQGDVLVVAVSDGNVHLVSLPAVDVANEAAVLDSITQAAKPPDKSMLPPHSVISTPDGRYFATVRNCGVQREGRIDLYKKTDDGSYQFWWSVPPVGRRVTAVSFLGSQTVPLLALACLDYALYTFNIEGRCLSDWSEAAGFPLTTEKIPIELRTRSDYPVRIGVDMASPSRVMMGSFGAIVAVDTAKSFPTDCRAFPTSHVRGQKRKRSHSTSGDTEESDKPKVNCTMCLRYNGMLFMDFVAKHEMAVVEQPWLNVVATFPNALKRRVYGT